MTREQIKDFAECVNADMSTLQVEDKMDVVVELLSILNKEKREVNDGQSSTPA